MSNLTTTRTLTDDILIGAAAIAAYTGESVRQIEHQLERGYLPAFKLGGRWRMRKSTYMAHLEKLECAAVKGT